MKVLKSPFILIALVYIQNDLEGVNILECSGLILPKH